MSLVGRLWKVLTQVKTISFVTPFHRYFFINDTAISYPFAEHERVPVFMNIVYAFFIPIGFLVAVNIAWGSSGLKHEATYLPLAISVTLTAFLTDIIKNAVGRPRPDLLARCNPAGDLPIGSPLDISACTTPHDSHRLQDGWRSFPSGHSSFSFAGLGFTSLYLAGQLGVFRPGARDLGRALFCFIPLVGAMLIAISRCADYRHDVYDVCFGSALGYAVAYWSYRRHWPRLSSQRSHEPYPPPGKEFIEDEDTVRWQRVRDEEEPYPHVGNELDII
ncbi:diacylglycerol diphosphate phosphatase / phosphatidate phosphatase [Geosmithia morbida]|uniref:Diacylglycerol diphosphate phosphatase / phosphatidate phosphatase n=1 Tax=Geosmithia morbida TaxID=1094350 RepID=A0A9P4YQS3_9HYPO|nr:diacylglycerol diphosphate phosphatase / phosphatidate phosphatase [Geosmithia morbida]KAF4121403.1 diacylglycerol diphosphate phosphatase / phosphatidate phosphatase [Geosmithia morbida]